MENASKALIIVGGVFIAIVILTIGVMLRNNLSKNAESYIENLDLKEIQKYNSNFTIYADTQKVITAQDIVTAIGIAKRTGWGTQVHVKFLTPTTYNLGGGISYTEYTVHGTLNDYTNDASNFDENIFLSTHILYTDENGDKHNEFKFDETGTIDGGITYDKYGRVSAIYFEQKN